MATSPEPRIPGRASILLVEDADFFRARLRNVIARHGLGRTVETGSGREAIALYRSGRFGLVLLDVVLPDLDGLEVLRTLRRDDPEAKVLVITAAATRFVVERAWRSGAAGVLGKPVEEGRLCRSITRALAGARGPGPGE